MKINTKNIFKALTILVVAILMLVATSKSTYAVDNKQQNKGSGHVFDIRNNLGDETREELEEKADNIAKKYNIKIVIYLDWNAGYALDSTIEGFYKNAGSKNDAGLIFYYNTYGEVGDRDYAFDVYGDLRDAITTNYGMDIVEEEVKDYLSDNKIHEAFDRLIDLVDDFSKAAAKGKPYSATHPYLETTDIVFIIVGCVVVSIVIGIIYIAILKAQMKTVHSKVAANEYAEKGGMNYTSRKDIFIYSHLSRIRRQTNNSSGGHGGGRSGTSMRRGKC